jgi:bifunctional pyridoxal-dependent enzyme with beta-cystathionase and maltose regulon repressor activities
MMNDWKVYGDPGLLYDTAEYEGVDVPEHHVRLNLATSRITVEQAFDRIRKSLIK